MEEHDAFTFAGFSATIAQLSTSPLPSEVLPAETLLIQARGKLFLELPSEGCGVNKAIEHILNDLCPAFNHSSRSPNYYGFVTGGSTPIATLSDNLVTAFDQNVQVHLPNETIATEVEEKALLLLCQLLNFDPAQWSHRTFTTGATASNIVGLACGREFVIAEASAHRSGAEVSIGELGIAGAMREAGMEGIQILTTVPHSSLSKAASILGLGRASVKIIGLPEAAHRFDMPRLKQLLGQPRVASIVAVSAAEVNTGFFATSSLEEMQQLRSLCDVYGAWIHVDGAFGILGRILTGPDYRSIISGCAGLELADSITGDGHKLLNVPYDCGFFLSRHGKIAERVFQNPNAAYLRAGGEAHGIMSPLNIGLENSRRFRALPVYANLVAYGRNGYRDMLERQIELSRGIAKFVLESKGFELLPKSEGSEDEKLQRVNIIVLFRAVNDELNQELVQKIKASRKVYVSGTLWDGKPACRFAVSNWQTDVKRDLPIITNVLKAILQEWENRV